jgi:hypothetical protein
MTEEGTLHHLPKANLKFHRLEDGRLLIVGAEATYAEIGDDAARKSVGEAAIIIHPDLLSEVVKEEMERIVRREFGHLTEDQALSGPYIIERLLAIRSTPSQGEEG